MCIRDSARTGVQLYKVQVPVFFILQVLQHADDVLDAVRRKIAVGGDQALSLIHIFLSKE